MESFILKLALFGFIIFNVAVSIFFGTVVYTIIYDSIKHFYKKSKKRRKK
jgi:hypothetical protein